jgi:hypothetical protein
MEPVTTAEGNSPTEEPQQARALVYRPMGSVNTMPLVRALGIIGIIVGSISISLVPLSWMSSDLRSMRSSPGVYWGSIGSSLAVIALDVMLLIGSIGCLRRAPRGRRLLIASAYLHFAYAIWGIGFFGWWYVNYWGAQSAIAASPLWKVQALGGIIGRFAAGLSLPIVIVILMRQPEVSQCFANSVGNDSVR